MRLIFVLALTGWIAAAPAVQADPTPYQVIISDRKASEIRSQIAALGCACPADLTVSCSCGGCRDRVQAESDRKRRLAQGWFVGAFAVSDDLKGWLYSEFDRIPSPEDLPNELEKVQKVSLGLIRLQAAAMDFQKEVQSMGYGAAADHRENRFKESLAISVRTACRSSANKTRCARSIAAERVREITIAMTRMVRAAREANWHRYVATQCSLPRKGPDDFLNPAAPEIVRLHPPVPEKKKKTRKHPPRKVPPKNPPEKKPEPEAEPPCDPAPAQTGTSLTEIGKVDKKIKEEWHIDPGPDPGELAGNGGQGVKGNGPGGGGLSDPPAIPGLPGGPPIWTIPGVVDYGTARRNPAPTRPPKRRRVDPDIAGKILRKGLEERDRRTGYLNPPAAGSINSAVALAVRRSNTPLEGRAVYSVTVAPNGRVEDVRLGGVKGGTPGEWSRALGLMREGLSGRNFKFQASKFPNGAVVTVVVDSSMRLPSGAKRPVTFSEDLKNSRVGIQFDVADLGGSYSRQIHSRFTWRAR